jgi:signal transduction histidine kinase
MRLFGKLQTHLILLVLIAVIPLVVLMFYTASEQRRLEMAKIEADVLTLAETAARLEEQVLDGSRQMLISLAHYFRFQWSDPTAIAGYLTDLLNRYRRYKNIGSIRADGRLHCSAVPYAEDIFVKDRSWFKNALATKEFAVGDYQVGRITGQPVIVLAYPILGADNHILGVAFAALDIEWLKRFQFGIEKNLPAGSTIAQVDSRGVILAHHPDPDTWTGRPLAAPLFEAIRSRQEGMLTAEDANGEKRIYAFGELFSNLRNQNVYFLLGIPERTLFASANRLLTRTLLLLCTASAIIMAAAFYGSGRLIIGPVKAMLDTARRLAKGDLGARTRILPHTGELNELAQAFDEMAIALERREEQRRQAEAEIRGSREQLRNLSFHLVSVREEERTRLAREIHDELGQGLTALKMDLSWFGKRLEPGQQQLGEKIRTMDRLVDETIRTVQRLSGELRPGLLDDLGLAAAIEWQAEEFQKRARIACDVSLDLGDASLSRDHATAIFRIFQETLTNVLRHARATRVSVLLQAQENQLTLKVVDNGRGITEEESAGAKAFGLIGMRERVLAFKGRFDIEGRPGKGTTVTVTVPLIKRGDSQ